MARPRLEAPNYILVRRPSGRWAVSWTEGGQSRRVSTGTADRVQAEIFLDQFVAGRLAPEPPPEPLVGDILDAYIKDRKRDGVRSPETLLFCAKALKTVFSGVEPRHIRQPLIREYARRRGLQRIANNTIIRELGTLRAALRWAARETWIELAPDFTMPVRAGRPRDRWLTEEEAGRLLAACKTPHMRLFVLLGLMTGARAGAILALRWDQVAEDRIDFGPGNTVKRRAVVPLHDERLIAELKAQREARTTDFVIEYHGKPVASVKKAFREACERAGVEDVSPNVMRHTAATWMVMKGVPIAEVARFLGNTKAMVERVYGKHSPDYLRRAAKALSF